MRLSLCLLTLFHQVFNQIFLGPVMATVGDIVLDSSLLQIQLGLAANLFAALLVEFELPTAALLEDRDHGLGLFVRPAPLLHLLLDSRCTLAFPSVCNVQVPSDPIAELPTAAPDSLPNCVPVDLPDLFGRSLLSLGPDQSVLQNGKILVSSDPLGSNACFGSHESLVQEGPDTSGWVYAIGEFPCGVQVTQPLSHVGGQTFGLNDQLRRSPTALRGPHQALKVLCRLFS